MREAFADLVGSRKAFAGDYWPSKGSYQMNRETSSDLVENMETSSDWAASKATFY